MGFKVVKMMLFAVPTLSFALIVMVLGCGRPPDPLSSQSDLLKPAPPTNLRGEALSADSVRLEWTDASENEQGFEIHESVGDDTKYTLLLPIEANTISIILTDKIPATKYFYKMLSYNEGGKGAFSDAISVTTPDVLPLPPVNLVGEGFANPLRVHLSWTDSSANEQAFRLQRKTGDAEAWTTVGEVATNTGTYTDNVNLKPDNVYLYQVIAYNSAGNSLPSNECTVQTPSADKILNAPSNLIATVKNSTSIELKWEDNSAIEEGCKIERKLDRGRWREIDSTVTNSTVYTDSVATPAIMYSYRVMAYDSLGVSEYSNEVFAMTTLPAPSDFTASVASSTSIELKWVDNSSDELGFKLERKTDGGDWAELKSIAENCTVHSDTGLTPKTSYSYRVRAFVLTGVSDWGSEVSVIPIVVAPSSLTVTAISSTVLVLKWTDNSTDEAGFSLERKEMGVAWGEIMSLLPNSTEYSDTGVIPHTTYSYRLCAFTDAGISEYSNTVSAIPILPAPSGLIATAISSTSVELKWTDNSIDEVGFKIERKTENGAFVEIKSTAENSTSYEDTGLTSKMMYSYQLRAFVAEGSSDYSNAVSVRTPGAGDTKLVSIAGTLFEFAWIPAGDFEMGSDSTEQGLYGSEMPAHTVTFESGFWMMTNEVTQQQWVAVMGSNPGTGSGVGGDYPVYNVSWNDIQSFEQNVGIGFGLPSEAEWEYACKAGTTTRFYWGDDPKYTQIEKFAWHSGNSGNTNHPVRQKTANVWGLYDMSGNVWEWCEDDWHNNYTGAPEDGQPWVDTPRGADRVLRGGSWFFDGAEYCRSASRSWLDYSSRHSYVGFRLVYR